MFVTVRPFQLSLVFVCNSSLEWTKLKAGSSLTRKHKARLERLGRDKHSSFLLTFLSYGQTSFIKLGSSGNFIKLFIFVADAAAKKASVFVPGNIHSCFFITIGAAKKLERFLGHVF